MKPENNRPKLWIIVGVVVLIILLIVWLTVADFNGDTDVFAPDLTQNLAQLLH